MFRFFITTIFCSLFVALCAGLADAYLPDTLVFFAGGICGILLSAFLTGPSGGNADAS